MKALFNTLLFILLATLTSCLNYTQVTTIKTDDSGKMYIHYWMHMDPDLDSLLLTKLGLFNEDSLKNIFEADFTELNFSKVYHDFTDSSLHSQIEFEFTNFDSLNKLQSSHLLNIPFENLDIQFSNTP